MKSLSYVLNQVIEAISTIAQELPSLETWVDVSSREELIPMKLCAPYLEEMQGRLKDSLTHLFAPIQEHLQAMALQYETLYSDKLKAVSPRRSST